MRNRLALRLAVSALMCAACTAVQAQTTIIETQGTVVRGLHEPARVTPVEPAPPAPETTTVESVTVEAKRLTRPEVEKRAYSFVQAYATPTAKLDQFARWREPVCVQVSAPKPADAARITQRIGEVAKTLGVKTLKAGCQANVEIIFADQPQHWLDWIASHRETVLGFHYVADTKTLKTVTRPIQAWYVTATRSNAPRSAALMFEGIPGVSAKDETLDDPRGNSPAGCGESRLTSCLQSVFKNVFIWVDTGRLKDPDLGPLSDYLAMLALSQPRSLDGCAAFASVIDLLAPRCPGRPEPDGLTPADTAYLKALYGANLEARRASEEVDIAGRMASSLIKATSASPAGAKGR